MRRRALQALALLTTVFWQSLPLASVAATPPGSSYTYDSEGRLVQAVISDGTTTLQIIYTYDQAGNLTNVSQQPLN
jgi:hypothetical protein